jgi:hypothetical protein
MRILLCTRAQLSLKICSKEKSIRAYGNADEQDGKEGRSQARMLFQSKSQPQYNIEWISILTSEGQAL